MSRPTVLALMPAIIEWLAANNIPPACVPVDCVPTVADGKITARVNRRNEHGRFYLDGDVIASKLITVPLLVEPPDVLKPWLAGKVPYRTTGEQRHIEAVASRLPEATDG